MKKIISFFLCAILLLTSLSVVSFAEEAEEELTNIAPNGLAYCTTMKHSNWTPPNSINDATFDWHGWEPKYPSVEPGQDTSNGFSGEYCGIKFLNREYYEIYEIKMFIGLHALYKQNVTYTIEALVEGDWTPVATITDSQAVPTVKDSDDLDGDGDKEELLYTSYEEAMEKDKSNYHIGATLIYTLETPITTNNIRINVSNFAKNYPGGDVLVFPYIYEVELIGKRGVTPDIDLPDGAEFSQNAAYNSIPYASSSKTLSYPYLAIDGKANTAWKPASTEAGQHLTLELEKSYNVEKLMINFGTYSEQNPNDRFSFSFEAFVDGEWKKIADSTANEFVAIREDPDDESSKILYSYYEYKLSSPVTTDKVRLVFDKALTEIPAIYEFEAHIVGERTYYLGSKFSAFQKSSSAKGNLAILGKAYASANFAPYSELEFINDGKAYTGSYVWFGGTLDIPVSCGVKLDKAYTVNKVVVYCEEPAVIGTDVTWFNILASIDGEYKVISKGKAYNPDYCVESSDTRYTTIYEFPEGVLTDDIKIEFTRGSSTIPNVMELEIYSDSAVSSAFDGYPTSEKVPTYSPADEKTEIKSALADMNEIAQAVTLSAPKTVVTVQQNNVEKEAPSSVSPLYIALGIVIALSVAGAVSAIYLVKKKKISKDN